MKREPEPIFSVFHQNIGSLQDLFSSALNISLNTASSSNISCGSSNPPIQESANDGQDGDLQDDLHDDDSNDDCQLVGDPDSVPLPLPSTADGLIKQKDDPISNDIPFITTVWYYYIYIPFQF